MRRKKKQSSKIPQPRVRQRHRRAQNHAWKHIGMHALFWVCVLGYGALCSWVFLVWDGARISQVVVTGAQRMDAQQIQQHVEGLLEGTMWTYMPRAQYVLVRSQDLERDIQKMSGIVRDVHVTKVFANKVIIDVDEWKHIYIWCAQADETCFLFDDDGHIGRAIAQDDVILRDNPVTRINDMSMQNMSVDTQVTGVTPLFIADIVELFAHNNVPLIEDVMYVPHRRAQELVVTTQEGWTVQISTQQPPEVTMTAVLSVLAHGMTPEERAHLVTVDVRLGRKVFYQTDYNSKIAETLGENSDTSKDLSLDE